ncbi:MAG: HAMP domain-containing sensor histidine kinase [Phycisphaerales bacterium]|jgi:signal transduction histidine kinase|nr:HAMP domain-containing sensor histidine kinase [Phycisphaerales bacterium]
MGSRLSLANKCLALFGVVILAITVVTLSIPWVRTSTLIYNYQEKLARELADEWILSREEFGSTDEEDASLRIQLLLCVNIEDDAENFASRAKKTFETTNVSELTDAHDRDQYQFFLYARPITESQLKGLNHAGVTSFEPGVSVPSVSDKLKAILIVRLDTTFAKQQTSGMLMWIFATGIAGFLCSLLAFYLILTRLVFSPVRKLRRVSEKVRTGDLSARSVLETGDEFEELSFAFNKMLDQMEEDRGKLYRLNETLDLKVEELASDNLGLFESGRLKNEFLANVSHELRTPLNSIIGFAELLQGMGPATQIHDEKRVRYINNILTSARSLLEMINELLDMAKIEAGRMEVNLEKTSVEDLLEGLVGIMRPQAKSSRVEVEIHLVNTIPTIETDPGKLQQILYNYLSNAIKFSPEKDAIEIIAELVKQDTPTPAVRIMVVDHGPGIPEDMIDMVFEKFRQVDASHTRKHQGTGLGLAICKELSELLRTEVWVESKTGQGASFFVEVPVAFEPDTPQPLMPT